MAVNIVVDGVILADCERKGKIRHGVTRVAEEITKRLINDCELDLYFANTLQTTEEDHLLRTYLAKLNGKQRFNILSYPFATAKVPALQKFSAKMMQRLYPGTLPGINKYNIYHSFYYPFSENVQKANITKSITYLDIIPLRMDGYAQYAELMKSIVRSITPNHAIAISQFSKDDLCNYDKRVEAERVFVVPLAADKSLFYQNRNRKDWHTVKNKYGLPDNYFLSISGTDKRKNLEHLMYAFNALVLQENTGDLQLVMTGNLSFEKTVFQQLKIDQKTRKRIVFAKPIEEADLSIVYSNALCFFFMSLYEGFGLPVLEAMQCGTPVITSDVTSLPEVVGNAGIMLPPNDEDALCSAMLKMCNDSQLRSSLSLLGLQQAAKFSWERCAAEYADIFKKIAIR